MTEHQLRNRKRRDLLYWGTFGLFLLSNILYALIHQQWVLWLWIACTALWLVTMFIVMRIEHHAIAQQIQSWNRNNTLFLSLLENMEMIEQSNMCNEDKQQALLYLQRQWQSREGA